MSTLRPGVALVFLFVFAAPLTADNERQILVLDGVLIGEVRSVSGGAAFGEVVEEPISSDYLVKKHLAGIRYEDIVFSVASMRKDPLISWVRATLARNLQRMSGVIVTTDNDGNAIRGVEFFDASIRKISFPVADSSSNEDALLTLHISPEWLKRRGMSGKYALPAREITGSQSAFEFVLDGIAALTRGRISGLVVDVKPLKDDGGRDKSRIPGRLELGNLRLILEPQDGAAFAKWHEEFVLLGKNTDADEKNAVLTHFGKNGKDGAFKVTFHHVGIFALRHTLSGKLEAELYVEDYGVN